MLFSYVIQAFFLKRNDEKEGCVMEECFLPFSLREGFVKGVQLDEIVRGIANAKDNQTFLDNQSNYFHSLHN